MSRASGPQETLRCLCSALAASLLCLHLSFFFFNLVSRAELARSVPNATNWAEHSHSSPRGATAAQHPPSQTSAWGFRYSQTPGRLPVCKPRTWRPWSSDAPESHLPVAQRSTLGENPPAGCLRGCSALCSPVCASAPGTAPFRLVPCRAGSNLAESRGGWDAQAVQPPRMQPGRAPLQTPRCIRLPRLHLCFSQAADVGGFQGTTLVSEARFCLYLWQAFPSNSS